jgi:hypothetical protein
MHYSDLIVIVVFLFVTGLVVLIITIFLGDEDNGLLRDVAKERKGGFPALDVKKPKWVDRKIFNIRLPLDRKLP